MPERVVADLEAVVGEEFHLREAPGCLLAVDSLVAEEGVAGGGAWEKAEDARLGPVRVLLIEIEPDPHGALRVDLELAVALDVAELAGGCVVEDQDDWAQPFGEVDFSVEDLFHGHGAVPVII